MVHASLPRVSLAFYRCDGGREPVRDRAMEERAMTKSQLASMLKTSRSQVDRLLDPTRDITLSTLQRAAALVGRKVQIDLI